MKRAGSDSWAIRVDEWDWELDTALWIRAAERIDVPAAGIVPMPLDFGGSPEPAAIEGGASDAPGSAPEGAVGAALAEGWLFLWNTLVFRPPLTLHDVQNMTSVRTERARFAPPDFNGLADFPDLHRVYVSRYREAHAWHTARKRTGLQELDDPAGAEARLDIEGRVVRAVEAEIGRKAAPFNLRVIVLPVAEDLVRPTGDGTYLVPERLRRSAGYEAWLAGVVRELA